MAKKQETVAIYLRLRTDIKDLVQDVAKSERRTFSQQIGLAIEEHLANRGVWDLADGRPPAKKKSK